MDYQEALQWLYGTQLHGIKLGLESVRTLLEKLGVSLEGARGPKSIHVAGTNGKGSVCAMLDAALRQAGIRTGLFTSPHLVDFRERIRVDGQKIPEGEIAALLTEIRELSREREHPPTFFEIATAAALAWFQRSGVEVAVLETGMGGRLDSTNVVTPLVSVLAPIGLDHQQWLGETLTEIAAEKAGIIKPGVPVVSAVQEEEAATVLRDRAAALGSPFALVESPYEGALSLAGQHQKWNAALAEAALVHSGLRLAPSAIAVGFARTEWPGRFDQRFPGLTLDAAHNPHAARQLVETWRSLHGQARATMVLGMVRDKDVAGVVAILANIAERFLVAPVRSARGLEPDLLIDAVRAAGVARDMAPCTSLEDALQKARTFREPILVTGSLFLIGEALAWLEQETPPPPSWQ